MIHDQWQPRKFPTLQDILRTVALEERGKGTGSMHSLHDSPRNEITGNSCHIDKILSRLENVLAVCKRL